MSVFLYSVGLQWKLDLRSKAVFVSCYGVPFLFFLLMGGVFTSVMPEMKQTLLPAMFVMSVSMGALIGLPSTLHETYQSEIKKVYQANNIPLHLGVIAMVLSTWFHLMILCLLMFLLAPVLFDAAMPEYPGRFFPALAIYICLSLGVGSILGLAVKNQARLTEVSQIVFLPSIMLSGSMFPAEMLPDFLRKLGELFPAYWGFQLMTKPEFHLDTAWYFLVVFAVTVPVCGLLLKR